MVLKKHKKLVLLLLTILPMALCGCWDSVEIEKRGYVLGVAIDVPKDKNLNSSSIEYMPTEVKGPLYTYTIQIPIIANSMNRPTGQPGSNSPKERQSNLTIVSNSFFEANREFSTQTDYAPYYPHLNSIVINESVAKEDISKLLDMFLRDSEIRRRTRIFITPDEAKKILDVTPKIDDYSSQHLYFLPNNNHKTSRMLHKTDLGKVSEAIHENRDFVLPKVISDKNNIIKNAGCAVFKDNKMVGWLDEIRTSYLKWITDYANGGTVSINLPEYEDYPVTLEIKKVKTKQRPIVNDDSVKMKITIKSTLSISELNIPNCPSAMNSELLEEIEKLAENKIKEQVEETISYVQKTYGADVFLFGVNINRFAPNTWDKIKDDWDQHFRYLDFDIDVKVSIKQFGLIK